MNILYGVSGEGFGHASRAKEIISHLEKKGHKVKILTYGQAYTILSKDFDVEKIYGLYLKVNRHKISILKTIGYNLFNFSKNFRLIRKFRNIFEEFKPDICISDMEPIVPILSYWNGIPLISIDNQHIFTNVKIKAPAGYAKDFFFVKLVVKIIVRKANYFILLSFYPLEINKKNTCIVLPILRKDFFKLKPFYGKKVLVYLTKKNDKFLHLLKKINEEFIVYGYDIDKKEDNIQYRTFGNHFLDDLEKCKAVIATAGLSLISESVYLKKPYLALPLKFHFEQMMNAVLIKKCGFGSYSENLKLEEISYFLSNLDFYRKNLMKHNFDANEVFVVLDKLLNKICDKKRKKFNN